MTQNDVKIRAPTKVLSGAGLSTANHSIAPLSTYHSRNKMCALSIFILSILLWFER